MIILYMYKPSRETDLVNRSMVGGIELLNTITKYVHYVYFPGITSGDYPELNVLRDTLDISDIAADLDVKLKMRRI